MEKCIAVIGKARQILREIPQLLAMGVGGVKGIPVVLARDLSYELSFLAGTLTFS